MFKPFISALGVAAIAFGVQCFFCQSLVVKTDVEKTVPVAEYWPYSLVCTGLVVYFYGMQLRKS